LKGVWAVPVIVSILILGTLGLYQDAEATPQEDIQSIIDDVTGLVNDDIVKEKDGKKLTKKLTKAIKDLDEGKTDKAYKDMDKFIKKVNKLVDKNKILQPDGQSLIDAAEAIKADISSPKQISLRDIGILQIATHDLVDVDRVTGINHEDGKLNLSTIFGHGDEKISINGEGRNRSNVMIFNVAQELVQFYFDLKDNQGMSKDEAIQKTVEKFHEEFAGAFERTFDEPLPKPKGGTVTHTENLAYRTLHDLIPGRIMIGGIETNTFTINPFTPLTDEELMQLGAELDGTYDPELLAIAIPFPPFEINLFERDSTFATAVGTKFSIEFFLEELEDGAYDKKDKVMKQIRNLISKGLNV